MMLFEVDNGLFTFAGAEILTSDSMPERAWAERSIEPSETRAWILGQFVEADNPNSNNQFWEFSELEQYHKTIRHSPLNVLHRADQVVGHFVDTEILFPTDSADFSDDTTPSNPYVDALAVFYKYQFPKLYDHIETWHANASLNFSMECLPKTVTCSGESGCGEVFDYKGIVSSSYCDHLNERASVRSFQQPNFVGGALIFPPKAPGWSKARVNELSELLLRNEDQAEKLYNAVAEVHPDSDTELWEVQMQALMLWASERES